MSKSRVKRFAIGDMSNDAVNFGMEDSSNVISHHDRIEP